MDNTLFERKNIPDFGWCHSHFLYVQELFEVDLTYRGVSAIDAYETYKQHLLKKNTKPLNKQEFGKVLINAFPERYLVTKKRRIVESGTRIRETYYDNLKIKYIPTPEKLSSSTSMDNVSKLAKQTCLPNKWICNSSDEISAEFVRIEDLPNRVKVLRVFNTGDWNLYVSGIPVKKENISKTYRLQNGIFTSEKLQNLLIACDEMNYCSGCTSHEYDILPKISHNSLGEQSSFTEVINGKSVKRSTACLKILNPDSKCTMCSACQKLNINLRVNLNRLKSRKVVESDNEKENAPNIISSNNINWRYLTAEQQRKKQLDEKRRRVNAVKREIYAKNRILKEREMIKLGAEDNQDVMSMFLHLDRGVDERGEEITFDKNEKTDDAVFFWKLQREVCKSGRPVWHPRFLEVCLRLWERTKEGYEELRDAGFFKLPSGRHLRYIKNRICQKPGIQKQQLQWMIEEGEAKRITKVGCNGYIVFDEMAIQGDLQLRKDGDCYELAGLVRLGELHDTMNLLQTGKNEAEMASHILQFTFVGCEGFQFPVCYYPTSTVDPVSLFHLYWDTVGALLQVGFFVHLGVCDGAQANRAFILAHFADECEAIEKGFTTINPYTGGRHTFMMDPPHNFKKLRNNLEKSTTSGKTPRHFCYEGKELLWKHLYDAFCYDHGDKKGLSTFQRLSEEHFFLNSSSRMRNYLADDVLGSRMLEVLENYKDYLQDVAESSIDTFDKTVELLNNTSILLKNFKSSAPYRSFDDSRLAENQSALNWFIDWKKWVYNQDLPAKTKDRMFLSKKTMFDLTSMVLGFRNYCHNMFTLFPDCDIKTSRTNQDCLEHFFGRQRAQNGQNNNPTELQYGSSINSIIRQTSRMAVSHGNSSGFQRR